MNYWWIVSSIDHWILLSSNIFPMNFSRFVIVRFAWSFTQRACHLFTSMFIYIHMNFLFQLFLIRVIISVRLHRHLNIIIPFHRQELQRMCLHLFVFNLSIVLYGSYVQVEYGSKKNSFFILSNLYYFCNYLNE